MQLSLFIQWRAVFLFNKKYPYRLDDDIHVANGHWYNNANSGINYQNLAFSKVIPPKLVKELAY